MTLKITISGLRGIVGESLTEEVAINFCRAIGTYFNSGKIVIGTDARQSRELIKNAAITGLIESGCTVVDIGICPTPTVQIMVRKLKAAGGIVITASHNPPEWNGIKVIRGDGIFLNAQQAEDLISIYNGKKYKIFKKSKHKKLKNDSSAIKTHVNLVLKNIDAAAIKKKNFKVAADCCNGAGCVITKELLKQLGCKVIAINDKQGKPVPRGLEPVPRNLTGLCSAVRENKCDIGFAQDPDADRLSIVDDSGLAIGEEYSVALAVDFVLGQLSAVSRQLSVVINLSTSRMIEDITRKFGVKVIRTKIGEVNVSEEMKRIKSAVGGEGNGGVIYPKIGYGRDSLAGIGLILNYLALSGKKISQIKDEIPSYVIVKDKISGSTLNLDPIKKLFTNSSIDKQDGVKISLKDSWVHVRLSNTEPIIRIIAEAKTERQAKELISKVKSVL